MQLDLFRNELVFTRMLNPKQFAKTLQGAKGIKFRTYKGTYYVPLAHIDSLRYVLRDYAGTMRYTQRYEVFANRFVVNPNPIHIDWYPDVCKISGKGVPWELIIPQSSYFTKAALQSKSYENKQWDGTVQLFDTINGEFPSGLLERFIKAMQEKNVAFTIKQHFKYPEKDFNLFPVFEFKPTKDQEDAVEALYKANNGIAKLPTGFGKTSFVAASLIARKGVRSMFLANQRVLINDAKEDFKQVFRNDDIHIGTIGDGEFDPGDITVASIQGIVAALTPPTIFEKQDVSRDLEFAQLILRDTTDPEKKLKAEKDVKRLTKKVEKMKWKEERSVLIKEYLKGVKLFIVDESQVLGTEMWNKFLHACPAPYRYTLSATDTRTDGGRVQIVAATGERRYESSAAEQIEKGRLSEFRGHFKRFDHGLDKEVLRDLNIEYHQAYQIFIVDNELRNQHLVSQLIKWAKEGNSVLALVTRRGHGENVQRILLEQNMPEYTFAYVDGNTPKKERNDIITRFRNSEFPILIGTSIFDVGFNAKNASKIVRFNAGGSEVREPQRAGRTVRVREDGSWGESYDMLDLNVPYFESQSFKRIKFLQEEFGLQRVKVLPGEIKGEANIVALKELINSIPDETDREKGEEILAALANRNEFKETDIPEMKGIDEIEKDQDLKSLMDQLRMDF